MGSFNGTIAIRQPAISGAPRFALTLPKQETHPGERNTYQGVKWKKRAEWNYYDANFVLRMPLVDLLSFFSSGLVRDVRIFDEDGQGLWEGFVYEMELDLGSAKERITIEDVYNKFWARYRLIGGSTDARTTAASDTVSQGMYSIKERVLAMGEQSTAAIAGQACASRLNLQARPKPVIDTLDISFRASAEYDYRINVKCSGYWKVFDWKHYNQTASSGTQGVSQQLADLVAAFGQFVAGTNIEANGTAVSKTTDLDRKYKDLIESNARMADASGNRWLQRMEWGRIFRYKMAARTTPATV